MLTCVVRRGGSVAAALVVVCLSAEARADESYDFQGGGYVGMQYADSDAQLMDFNPWLYPTAGFFIDQTWFHADMQTPMGFVILDLIAALIEFASGNDNDLPMLRALNGDEDPGRIRLFAINTRATYFHDGPHHLEAGVHMELSNWTAYLRGSDRERFGFVPFDFGPSLGYSWRRPDTTISASMHAGSGFSNVTNWNPFWGSTVMARGRLGDSPVFLFSRFDYTVQRIELNHDDDAFMPQFELIEWAHSISVTTGIAFGGG